MLWTCLSVIVAHPQSRYKFLVAAAGFINLLIKWAIGIKNQIVYEI